MNLQLGIPILSTAYTDILYTFLSALNLYFLKKIFQNELNVGCRPTLKFLMKFFSNELRGMRYKDRRFNYLSLDIFKFQY